jgi:hypothetical protein
MTAAKGIERIVFFYDTGATYTVSQEYFRVASICTSFV